MESVEGTHAQAGGVAAGEVDAGGKEVIGQGDDAPDAHSLVTQESLFCECCFLCRYLPSEYMLIEGMGPLCFVQRSEPFHLMLLDAAVSLCGVDVGYVEREEDARIRIDAQ